MTDPTSTIEREEITAENGIEDILPDSSAETDMLCDNGAQEADDASDTYEQTAEQLSLEGEVDYERLMAEDLDTLKRSFPELRGIDSITGLNNPLRYAQLRDLGLSAAEAYLATSSPSRGRDTRAHLSSSVPKRAHAPSGMSHSELVAARALFSDLTDAQIQSLYNRVKD